MDNKEANIVAKIASTADGGCTVCIFALASLLKDQFPTFDWFQLIGDAGGWNREIIESASDDDEKERRLRAELKELNEYE